MKRNAWMFALLFIATALAGCSGNKIPAHETAIAKPIGSFNQPTQVIPVPQTEEFLIVERHGRIVLWNEDSGKKFEVLDVTDVVSTSGERGLKGLALSPDFESTGVAFITYDTDRPVTMWANAPNPGGSVLARIEADPNFLRGGFQLTEILLDLDYREHWHTVGGLRFADDGTLYVSFGEGTGAMGTAQNLSNLHGSILRIQPGKDSGYAVPDDNPFVGDDDALDEIFIYGIRNVWRFDFDGNGGLWLPDTGEDNWEEVNHWTPGAPRNLGWPHYEGTDQFSKPEYHRDYGPLPEGEHLVPVAQYDHGQGCAVVGGQTYRGNWFGAIEGSMVVSDHCFGTIYLIEPGAKELDLWMTLPGERINSIDADANGELLVSGFSGTVYRISRG